MKRSVFLLGLALPLCLVGCGGSTAAPESPDGAGLDAGPDAPPSDASARDAPSGDTGLPAACPTAVPSADAPCTQKGLTCEYGGTGDHLLCSTRASCQPVADGTPHWVVSAPAPDCVASQDKNPAACPASFTSLATGASCPDDSLRHCVYPEGVCGCLPCVADGATRHDWKCEQWPMPDGCPEPRPRLGSACSVEGQTCAYVSVCGVVNVTPYMQCASGQWTLHPFGATCRVRNCGE